VMLLVLLVLLAVSNRSTMQASVLWHGSRR
jgi:hypothetical protein